MTHDDLDTMADRIEAQLYPLEHKHFCTSGSLLGISEDGTTLLIAPATCRRWDCPDCAQAKAGRIYAKVRSARPERHITLTCNPALFPSPDHALEKMKDSIRKLAHAIRKGRKKTKTQTYEKPRTFEYAVIWELHQSGWPHAHLAQWGDYVPHQFLRQLWKKLTGATIVYIVELDYRRPDTHSWSKYLIKAIPRDRSLFFGKRMISFSANFDRNGFNDNDAGDLGTVKWHKVLAYPGTVIARLLGDFGIKPQLLPSGRLAWDISPDRQPLTTDELLAQLGALNPWNTPEPQHLPPPAAPRQPAPQRRLTQGRLI